MCNVHLLCGIPASGKSTFAAKKAAEFAEAGRSIAIISRDVCRKALVGEDVDKTDYFSRENEVFENFISEINNHISAGTEEIFIDATHISAPSREKVLSQLNVRPGSNLILEVFPVALETAIERNNTRQGFAFVPLSAMRRMSAGWQAPTLEEVQKHNKFGFASVIIDFH